MVSCVNRKQTIACGAAPDRAHSVFLTEVSAQLFLASNYSSPCNFPVESCPPAGAIVARSPYPPSRGLSRFESQL